MRGRGGSRRPVLLGILTCALAACASADRAVAPAANAAVAPALPPSGVAYGREDPIEPSPIEADIANRVREATGARLRESPALSRAARLLATAAAAGATNPIGRSQTRAALAAAAAFDPAPYAHLASGPPAAIAASLAPRAREHEVTHFGVGVAERDGTAWAVLLSARRSVRLDPFPRDLPPRSEATLRGELIALHAPRVVLTRPNGQVQEFAAEGDRRFSARLRFAEPGRHFVEILGSGAQGPEVVALLAVDVGHVSAAPPDPALPQQDPEALADAEARIEDAVNALRRRYRLPPLRADPAIGAVARRHSRDMLAAGRVAHVLPQTGDVAARMRRARLPFDRVLENVARGPSGIDAHGAAEDSPAHRAAMLDPGVRTMGCGLARGVLPSGDPVVYLTEIFVEPPTPPETAAELATSATRIHRLLNDRLAAQERPLLARDPELDELAAEAARSLVRRDSLALPAELNEEALKLPGRTLAVSEAFVGSDIGDAARTRHLADPRFRRIGVGVATGSSARYGAQRLWMVLVFTD